MFIRSTVNNHILTHIDIFNYIYKQKSSKSDSTVFIFTIFHES